MGNAFRNQPAPALYPDNKTPVTEDVLEVGLLFAASIVAFSFILIIPGIRGIERLWATVRVFTALFIGTVILVSNFGYCWYCGSICTRTQYKAYVSPAGSPQEIEARVGVYIGLRGTNITLREASCEFEPNSMKQTGDGSGSGEFEPNSTNQTGTSGDTSDGSGSGEFGPNSTNQTGTSGDISNGSESGEFEPNSTNQAGADVHGPFPNEEIDYNERIYWADPWGQGRLGFGRYAGRYNREFRELQFRGAPYPILWIAEYFTLDGELIRWGRKFRTAGWYTHILLWTSFATYLIAILLFIFTIQQGAWFTVITGSLMILAVFAYGIIIINDPPFEVPFQDAILKPSFGWSWWLTLWTGVGTFFLGIFILILNKFWPSKAAALFHHSVVDDNLSFSEDKIEEPTFEEYGTAPKIERGQGGSTRGRTRRGLKPRNTVRPWPEIEVPGKEVIELQEAPTTKEEQAPQ